jgi:radical SAM protein with 4Fe4S-binding SPASM domain
MSNYLLKELKIEVTYECPLACVHCSSDAGENNKTCMTKEKCLQIIKEATELGLEEITFSGGEPLLWEGICESIQLANSMDIKTGIYTSGNGADINQIFTEFHNVGLDRAIFSLYSDVKEEHNRVTRKAESYDNTLYAIEIARSLGIASEIHFVALASNYKKLRTIVEFSKNIGICNVSVLRFVPQGRGTLIRDYDTMSKNQNIELRKEIIALREEGYSIRTGSPFNVLFLNENPKCMAAQDRLIINPRLDIFPCDAFKQIVAKQLVDDCNFSDLTDSTLKDCWTNSNYLDLVRSAIIAEPSEPCKVCQNYKKCLSGCLAQKFLKYNSLYKNPDPACLDEVMFCE